MSGSAAEAVSALAAARKAVQLYPPTHPKHVEALRDLEESVHACTSGADGSGALVVNLYQGRLYCGSDVIAGDVPGVSSVGDALEARRVESLTFDPGFGAADAVGLIETLALRPSPDLDVSEELKSRGVTNVQVAFLVDEADSQDREQRDRRREQDRAMHKQMVAALRTMREGLAGGQQVRMDQASSVAQSVAARVFEDRAAMLGLATLTSHGETGLFHGVNVMIYALTIGAALDISEENLISLGIAALLHDVGKAAFDAADPDQAERIEVMHPTVGAEILSRIIDEDSVPMLVAYEHHMYPDGSGYPERPADYFTHPYSRIVAVADRYENLSKPDGKGGSAQTPPLTPDRAVAQLLSEAGPRLDPLFTRLFVRALGVIPIGCCVRLCDQSVGVVCDTGDDPLRPKVRVVHGPCGERFETPEEVDLAADGRDIVEVLDPGVLKMTVADHL